MKSVQDAIYNWLTIKAVCDSRQNDSAALETEEMFYSILLDEYGLSNIQMSKEDGMYYVKYERDGKASDTRFPKELIEVMLNQINEAPDKYANYPE